MLQKKRIHCYGKTRIQIPSFCLDRVNLVKSYHIQKKKQLHPNGAMERFLKRLNEQTNKTIDPVTRSLDKTLN